MYTSVVPDDILTGDIINELIHEPPTLMVLTLTANYVQTSIHPFRFYI